MSEAQSRQLYRGLLTYQEDDSDLFFGREREVREMIRLLENDFATILYGVTGVGKSSLLRAGLLRPLKRKNYLPVIVRLEFEKSSPTPTRQILLATHAAATAAGVQNHPEPAPEETLWEYFHHPDRAEYWTADFRLLTPLIALDQFEEFFNEGDEDPVRRELSVTFRTQLLDLLGNRRPSQLDEKVLWHYAPIRWRLLLILREDFVGQLLPIVDELAEILPSIHRQKLRLKPFDESAVTEVVEKPWEAAKLLAPEPGVASAIAAQWHAADRGISPAQLSILLTAAHQKLAGSHRSRLPVAWFKQSTQEQIDAFLNDVLGARPEVRRSLEEHFVSRRGYRRRVHEDDIDLSPGSVSHLVEHGVLICHAGSSNTYELSHDLLSGILATSRAERHAREEQAQLEVARQRAEDLDLARLRAENAHREAEEARRQAERARGEAEDSRGEAVNARAKAEEAHEQAKDACREAVRRAKILTVVSVVAFAAFLIAGGLLVYAQIKKGEARDVREAGAELMEYLQYGLKSQLKEARSREYVESIKENLAKYENPGKNSPDAEFEHAIDLLGQADGQVERGSRDEAFDLYRTALEIADFHRPKEPKDAKWPGLVAWLYNKLGDVRRGQGRYEEAMGYYDEAMVLRVTLALQKVDDGQRLHDLSESYNCMGDCFRLRGNGDKEDFERALELYRASLGIRQKLGEKAPENKAWQQHLAVGYACMGEAYFGLGDLHKSLKYHRLGFKIRNDLLKVDPGNSGLKRDLCRSYYFIGLIHERLAQKDPEKWKEDLGEAWTKLEESKKLAEALAKELAEANEKNVDWNAEFDQSKDAFERVKRALGEK